MAEYTKGPWDFELVEEHSVRPTVATIGDYRVVRAGPGARGYDLHGQDEDDARLIAAAPDLLEALKAVVYSGDFDAAIAAIIKAEGRS